MEKLQETVDFLKKETNDFSPEVAIILVFPMAICSGLWWPLSVLPQWLHLSKSVFFGFPRVPSNSVTLKLKAPHLGQ